MAYLLPVFPIFEVNGDSTSTVIDGQNTWATLKICLWLWTLKVEIGKYQFSANSSTSKDNQYLNVDNKISFGLHHEQIKHTDYVSESLKEKIGSGEYVSMVHLLIPEYEQMKKKTDHYCGAIEYRVVYGCIWEV